MGAQLQKVEKIKARLATCQPDDVEDFFKFIEEQLEMNRNANSGIKQITSKDQFYQQELRYDKIQKLLLLIKQ
jgi:hypothetical protein